MKNVLFTVLLLFASSAFGQESSIDRNGIMFGCSVGGGFHTADNINSPRMSIPNLKFGYMLQPKFGLVLYLPGGVSQINESIVAFEAFLPSVQYFLSEKWYVLAGAGLSVTTTPFYEVDYAEGPPEFYFGPGVSIVTGYEIFQLKNKFAIDIQTRVLWGNITYDNNIQQQQAAFDLLIGFNIF
jgi:hypothetical protein